MATGKTFYIETFGCQMNAHDSEKVIGSLQHQVFDMVIVYFLELVFLYL